jgi:hypothetical protein
MKPEIDFDSVLAGVCSVVAAAMGQYEPDFPQIGPGLSAIPAIYGLTKIRAAKDIETVPNPYFVSSGHEGTGNPKTQQYLQSRALKTAGAAGIGIAGSLVSIPAHGVDPLSGTSHINAAASSGIHLTKLMHIASRYRQSKKIAEWCKLLIKIKAVKAGLRSSDALGSLIPMIAFPASIINGVATTAITSYLSKGTVGELCARVAAEIHWRAFQESVISGRAGRVGPATEIMYEMFQRRGFTRLLGSYDIASLIKEPAGWMAIQDKILLL